MTDPLWSVVLFAMIINWPMVVAAGVALILGVVGILSIIFPKRKKECGT